MNRIAVCVDEKGVTSSITKQGFIRTYIKTETSWRIETEIPYMISPTSSIMNAKKYLTDLLQTLHNCKIFVATEISGQLYYLLEAHGFNSYETEGLPESYLDDILETELTESKDNITSNNNLFYSAIPKLTDQPGIYSINLSEALAANPELSSKRIIKPFLQKKNFEELEVYCDHIPRWFDMDLKTFGLTFVVTQLSQNEYKISINRKGL